MNTDSTNQGLSISKTIATLKQQYPDALILMRRFDNYVIFAEDAIKAGADAFITGEMHYHVYAGHEQEIQICVIGHYQSEQYTAHLMKEVIDRECPGIKTIVATTNTNPIVYI